MLKKGADSQEDAIECVLGHHIAPFQQMQITEISFLSPRNIATRTYAQISWVYATLGLVELSILKDNR